MYWSRAFGRKGFLLTAWIGVPIHELGHAIMCVLFRHKIVATQFFPTDTSQGALATYNINTIIKVYINELGTSLSASGLLFLVLLH